MASNLTLEVDLYNFIAFAEWIVKQFRESLQ